MPTDIIAWLSNLSGPAVFVLVFWAIAIKDPPLLVLGSTFRELKEQLAKQEAKTERYLSLVLKINDQANKSTHVAEEALNVAKGKATGTTTTGGRVGSKGRQTDANEMD